MSNSEYNLSVVDGSNLTLVLNGPQGPAGEADAWLPDVFVALPPEEGNTSIIPTSDWWNRIVECAYDVSLPYNADEYIGKRFILRTTAEIAISMAYANGVNLASIPAPTVEFGSTLTLIESIGGVWMATINYTGVPSWSSLNTGRTIFVDNVTGNDTRGTLSQYSISTPFKTIGAAMSASAIGDTVRVRAGSYTISSTITLNNKGNLHLEEGAVVTCSVAGAPVFTLSVDQAKVISGGGQFVINGTTTKFWQQTGGTTTNQLCSIECYSILQTSSTPIRIFEVTTGVLVVQAGTVYTPTSTIAYCEGTSSNVNYRVPFTYCARMVDMPTSGSTAQFSCACQTIQCFGTKCFRVVGGTLGIDYETLVDATGICTFFSFEYGSDATTNGTSIRGGRAITYSANPCINFSTSTGTNKFLRFYGDPFFYTNGTNSITAASSRTVVSSTASSNKPVQGTVSIVGNYTVNSLFLY